MSFRAALSFSRPGASLLHDDPVAAAGEDHLQPTRRLSLADLNSHVLQSVAEAAALKGIRLRRKRICPLCLLKKNKEQATLELWRLEVSD